MQPAVQSSLHNAHLANASEPEGLKGDLQLPEGRSELTQEEILGLFKPAEQEIIKHRLHVFSAVAYHIGKDFKMPVELNLPGGGWHWDFNVNKVRVDPSDLLHKPLDFLRFVIAHEGGHRRISRMD